MAVETGQYIQDGSVTWIVTDVRNSTLVGSITMYAGNTTPAGYLLCDGAAISRTDYKTLYDVIGTTYGEGDGDSTFNLPLLTDNRFVEFAATAGEAKDAGLPNITAGFASFAFYGMLNGVGAISLKTKYNSNYYHQGAADNWGIDYIFDASKSNTIYGNSNTVQPTALTIRPIIRYI